MDAARAAVDGHAAYLSAPREITSPSTRTDDLDPRDARAAVTGTFATRTADLGFHPPPFALRLRLLATAERGRLYMQANPPGPVARAAEWLEPYGPRRVEFEDGHVLRVEFDALPEAWLACFRNVAADAIHLQPDGTALVTVTGERAGVAAFAARLGGKGRSVRVRPVATTPARPPLLTAPQESALRAAVACGYYDIPRPINLRDLAGRLGVTSASLSERLRRAEGRVIKRYVADGGPPAGTAVGDAGRGDA